MAHSIVKWLNTPDTWEMSEVDLTSIEERYFILENGTIKTFVEGEWVDTNLTEPLTDEEYLEFGIEDLSEVTEVAWNQLGDIFELISWEEDLDVVDNKWLNIDTANFSPLMLLNEKDDFEILTYSDKADSIPYTNTSTEETVDSGQLFINKIDIFDTITSLTLL